MIDYKQLEKAAHENISKKIIALDEAIVALSKDSSAINKKFNEVGFLKKIDESISISEEKLQAADAFYSEFTQLFSEKFALEDKYISIYPQGSASTKTVIRSATGDDFDIDAVAEFKTQPEIDPLVFFDKIGDALKELSSKRPNIKVDAKKRCWRVNLLNSGFYMDLIPSVTVKPLNMLIESKLYKYSVSSDTVIYIVDTQKKQWQSSNPKGFTQWLLDANEYSAQLVKYTKFAVLEAMDSAIEKIPHQKIQSNDYLLLAIRLLKRHRDMYYRNKNLDSEYKPISIIICTLVGQTVKAMYENNRTYESFFNFFYDLVMKLPLMIQIIDDKYLIPNPTAIDENFADRWSDVKDDGDKRRENFFSWGHTLVEDMEIVIQKKNSIDAFDKMKDMFGVKSLEYKPETGEFLDHSKVKIGITSSKPKTPSSKVPSDGLA